MTKTQEALTSFEEYAPIKAQLDGRPPETAPAIRATLQRDLVAQMPWVALAD